MGFQTNGLAPELIREMLEGIVEDEKCFADIACGQQFRVPTALTGNVNVKSSSATLGTIEGYLGLAPGEEALGEEFTVSSVAYEAKARVGKAVITDEERNDYDNAFTDDAYNALLTQAYRTSGTKLDKFLETKLESTVLNGNAIAGAGGYGVGWGASASDMLKDIRLAREVLSPGADTFIVGRVLRNVMLGNDGLLATPLSGNNYGGGSAEESILSAWLKQYGGFTNVLFFDRMYNSAGARGNTDPTVAYFFDNFAWVGYSEDLVLVHPNHPINDLSEESRTTEKRSALLQFTRYDDIIRPTKLKGGLLTGFTATS